MSGFRIVAASLVVLAAGGRVSPRGKGPPPPLSRKALSRKARGIEERLRRLLASRAFLRARRALAQELERRRREALAWIFDPSSFRKGHGIREMEDRVGRVRELWEKPETFLAARVNGLGEVLERAGEISRAAREAGWSQGESFRARLLSEIRKAAALEEAGIGKAQARWNREVLAWNEKDAPTSADPEEMLVMDLTNRYRLMMGMRALEVDERIVRAARKHSVEMEEMGYFSHTSPVKDHADFATRIRQEGYSGPRAENIAVARDGKRAFRAWFLSAGHHRNLLDPKATAFGVGRSPGRDGRIRWTMNLGAGDSLRGRTLRDPVLLYLRKRRRLPPGDAKARLALAKWCLSVKLIPQMCRECREALKLDPSLEEARKLLARRFRLQRR